MTIPWLMNCGHQDKGWCLACVAAQGEELCRLKEAEAERTYCKPKQPPNAADALPKAREI